MEQDLFLEMLEVYINSILYVRDVYPSAIFRKRRVYSTIAYISIFPPLNRYLLNVLKTAQELQAANKLFKVELIIFQQREFELFSTLDDEEILEKYVFRIERNENSDKMDLDAYIFQFEENLRRGLLELNQKTKNLPRLNSESCGWVNRSNKYALFRELGSTENQMNVMILPVPFLGFEFIWRRQKMLLLMLWTRTMQRLR